VELFHGGTDIGCRVANLAFLKPDFENLAFFKRVWLFFKNQKKPDKIWPFLAFFEVFCFISKIKKRQTKSGFFLDLFRNNTARICSLRQCDPLTGSVV